MFKFITLALIFSLFMVACGSSNDEEETSNEETEQEDVEKQVMDAFEKMAEDSEAGESLTCEEYLDNFEKWADKYIEMLGKVKKNPSDAALAVEYAKLAPEMATWANQWQNQVKCTQDEEFMKRYKEITDRIDAAAEELE